MSPHASVDWVCAFLCGVVLVEHLARSLLPERPEDLLDSPDILARIAKELIQESMRKQSDAAAAIATRLDM